MEGQSKISKLIKLVMAFAIFWMVIGDLITFHQAKIFGNHFFDTHSPFTKPKSKDDGKTISFHAFKFQDKQQNTGQQLVHQAILQTFAGKVLLVPIRFIFTFIAKLFHQQATLSAGLLRAPPRA